MNAAVIGTGGAGQLHLEAYAQCPHTKPVAVVSHSAERAAEIAARHNVRPYTSVEAMLTAERPDVVSVATLEWDHEEPVLQSLAAGAHVLCEKIMAHSLASGERMVAAAGAAKRTLGVNYNYRTVPAIRALRDEVRHGSLVWPGFFVANMHAYLLPHWLDLLRFVFGDPAEVSAAMVDDQAQRPPVSNGPSGVPWRFALHNAGVGTSSEMLYHPSIGITARFRFHNPEFLAALAASALVPLEQNFWSYSLYGRQGGGIVVDRATRANLNGVAVPLTLNQPPLPTLSPCSYSESFFLSVAAFAEAVASGRPAPVTGEDGLAALRLDAAMVESARNGRAVRLT